MLYGSNANISRRGKRLMWATRPAQPIDSPVKRYLKSASQGQKSRSPGPRHIFGRILHPAF